MEQAIRLLADLNESTFSEEDGKRKDAKAGMRQAGRGKHPWKDTYYGRKARENRSVWCWSGLLALLCTFISYPGIWYSDSYVRVATGSAVLNAVVKTLTGHRFVLETGNAFTVIPSFFLAASLGMTGHVGVYTFVQAFSFFAAVFLLIRALNPAWRRAQTLLFALCPLVYGVSVYYEANIGSLVGIIGLLLLFRDAGEEKTGKEQAVEFLLVALSAFVAFGYRTNALTVVPVLVVWLWRETKGKAKRWLPLCAMAAGLALVWLVPWAFGVQSQSNGTTGFVWEMITTIQRMDADSQAEYADYLDEIGGEGATQALLESSTEVSANDFMWGEAINTAKLSAPGASGKAIRKYFQLIREKPGAWFQVKKDFVLRALGVPKALDYSEYNYNRWEGMGEYGFNDSRQRWAFYASYLWMNEKMSFLVGRPWVMFLLSLLLMMIEWVRKNEKRHLYVVLFWTAVFSYGAYLVVIVGFEVRFFYPALLLMLAMDGAILLEWLRAGTLWLGRKWRKE